MNAQPSHGSGSASDDDRLAAESFDAKGMSFISVTQQLNTTTSMGRLTLNVLLSFAQYCAPSTLQ